MTWRIPKPYRNSTLNLKVGDVGVFQIGQPLVDHPDRTFWIGVQVDDRDDGLRYLCRDGQLRKKCSGYPHPDGWYASREEADFRLLLFTDPAQALAPFLRAQNAVYTGCERDHDHDGNCDRHPQGCPRDPHQLRMAADWWGDAMEATVLRELATYLENPLVVVKITEE